MDYSNQGQVAVGNYAALNYAAQAKTAQPETMLESVVSRLSTIRQRLNALGHRTTGISNTISGYHADKNLAPGKPEAIASSITDYLGEIESELNQIESNLGRIS